MGMPVTNQVAGSRCGIDVGISSRTSKWVNNRGIRVNEIPVVITIASLDAMRAVARRTSKSVQYNVAIMQSENRITAVYEFPIDIVALVA